MRFAKLIPALFLFATCAVAQVSYNTITATVVDSNSNPFASAMLRAYLVNGQGYPVNGTTTPNGQPFNGSPTFATLDATGHFSIQLVPNGILRLPGAVTLGGSKWRISISAPQDPNILVNQNAWNLSYDLIVTGDQDISTQLNSLVTQTISYINLKTNRSSFNSGSSAPAGPSYAVQFANLGVNGLQADSSIAVNPAQHSLSAANLATPGPQSLGSSCAGFYTGGNLPPSGCHSFNYSPMEPYGGTAGNEYNFLVLASQESTPASTSTYNGFGGLEIYYKSAAGGAYTFNGSSGSKSNYMPIQIQGEHRTVGQKYGINNNVWSFSGGDTLPLFNSVYQFGGFLENGDEQTPMGEFLYYNGDGSTDSIGGVAKGTITGISGNTVSYTPVMNENKMGEARFIRDIGSKYSTGTYSGVTCSGTSPTTCTVTGSGTAWTSIPGFIGTHTTWNSLSTGGPLLTNNLVFCAAPAANGGYDSCVPITQGISDTSFTMNLYATGSSMNTSWPWATSGSYTIYRSAYPNNVDVIGHSFIAGDISGLTVGHTFDQVLAYNPQPIGLRFGFFPNLGIPFRGEGITVFNSTTSPNLKMGFGYGLDGPFHEMFTIGQEGMAIQPDFLFQSAYDFASGVFSFNNITSNTMQFLDYTDSANAFWNALKVYRSSGTPYQGISIFDKALFHPTRGLEGMPSAPFVVSAGEGATDDFNVKNTAQTQINFDVDESGNATATYALVSPAGGTGWASNLIKYSQHDSGNPAWTQTCPGNPMTLTPNTTDIADPWGTHTVLKIVAPATLGCSGYYSQIQQTPPTDYTNGLAYTYTPKLAGAVGGETVIVAVGYKATGGGSCSVQVTLTTTLAAYPMTCTIDATYTQRFVSVAVLTPGATIYEWGDSLVQGGSQGIYVHTISSPQTPVLATVLKGEVLKPTAGTGAALASGPASGTVVNDAVCYADTVGTQKDCGVPPGGGTGSGTVNSGSGYALPMYGSAAGTAVSPSNLTSDSTGNNLNVPGSIKLGASPPTACGSAVGCASFNEGATACTPTVGQDCMRADSTTHKIVVSLNGAAETPLGSTGSGLGNIQITTGTASVGPLSCTAETTVAFSGLLTTSSVSEPVATGTDPTSVSGWAPGGTLYISRRVISAGSLGWRECNSSATSSVAAGSSITWNIGAQ